MSSANSTRDTEAHVSPQGQRFKAQPPGMSHPRAGPNSAQRAGRESRTRLGTVWETPFLPLSGLCFPRLGDGEVGGRMCFV